tara:strand:- start:518 stop:844 length:327 start_codon:yes stop_codon:yes gene_type:complete
MKKYKFNWDIYPDGISKSLEVFDDFVWNRGYYLETDEGVWHEMYVNDLIKSENPNVDENKENEDPGLKYSLERFHGLLLDHYQENSQITFFVQNEYEYDFNGMTDFFA